MSRCDKISFGAALGLHVLLVILLLMSFEKTIVVSAPPSPVAPNKEIIEAVMVNKKVLQDEVARLEEKEAKKRALELERKNELERRTKEAKLKREKEEALAIELKNKNEELKKQIEEQRLAEQQREKERQATLKKEQEEKKRRQKEKEEFAAKQKTQEAQRKLVEEKQNEKELAEQQAQQAANTRAKQDEITRYALLMRNKIHQNWRQPIGFDFGGLTCKVAVKLLPTGEVVDAVVVQSSGNLEFDRSTELAIRKASPLPMPEDAAIAKEFHQFTFTFRPEAA